MTFSLSSDRQDLIDLIILGFSKASVAVPIHEQCSLGVEGCVQLFLSYVTSDLVTPAAAILHSNDSISESIMT